MRLLPVLLTLAVVGSAQSPDAASPTPTSAVSPSEAAPPSEAASVAMSPSAVENPPAEATDPTDAAASGPDDAATDAPADQAATSGADASSAVMTPPADASANAPADASESPPADPPSTTAAAAADSECSYCTIPEGYTKLDIPAPLGVEDQFSANWRGAHKGARAFMKNWCIEDKVNLVTGVGWMVGRCVGNTPALPKLDWKGLCLGDSPLGVRLTDYVTAFPAGINAAATFDKDLIYNRGRAMGSEFRGKGINVALGPMTNMGRLPAAGRNWEGFGGDPYLSGIATEETVHGLQEQGVQATVKHYILNEQERNRTTSSSNIDDRTIHEIYAHPFLRAVMADVSSVMCSYQLINGSWACQDSQTLNGLLKTEYGFGGYVMSDWNAQHSGVLSANSGLDMSMPGDIDMNGGKSSYWGPALVEAVKNGSVSMERLDDMAQRIMAAWFLTKQNEGYPDVNFNAFTPDGPENLHVDVQRDHYKIVREIGAASAILLKNVNNALPLCKPKSIAIIGSDMGPAQRGPNGYPDRGGLDGTLAMGWGSGTAEFPYLIDPLAAITQQARQDRSTIRWWLLDWDTEGAANTATYADVAIVGVASDSGEGYITVDGNEGDRNNLSAWNNGDELVKAVAAVNKNTVVVVHSVGPMDVEQWIDHPNVTAVVWAGLPGQESGNGLVDVLYGAVNPSGRLPYTVAKKLEDYPAQLDYVNTNPPVEPQVNYTEGIFIDYRHFQKEGIEPRFPFGFGMSYTTFEYSNLQVSDLGGGKQRRELVNMPVLAEREEIALNTLLMGHNGPAPASNGNSDTFADGNSTAPASADNKKHPAVKIGASTAEALHAPRWMVKVDVKNTGDREGHEVPQLYLAYPPSAGEPPRVLRDFDRIKLNAGEQQTVSFNLSTYDVSVWDVVSQSWVVPQGQFTAIVAKSSADTGVSCDFTPKA